MPNKTLFCLLILTMCATFAFASPVPDTGQTKCYDETSEITCPGPGEPVYGQDGNYSINSKSYTKLDADGNNLPVTANSWRMVRDNVTGLIWEVKTSDASVNDKDNTYTWHDDNPATNAGIAGTPGDGTDTDDYINALNAQSYGGYSDWRLPTQKELGSIVNKERVDPAVDTDYFPNTVSSEYWSSTSYIKTPDNARYISFSEGEENHGSKSDSYYVRAVRSEQHGILDSFVSNGDGTATDKNTGLMWQQEAVKGKHWKDALTYCEDLSLAGHDDWRLPTVEELRSIVDYSGLFIAVNSEYFPNTGSVGYWSSTTFTSRPDEAWLVDFFDGLYYHINKSNGSSVRAVRGGDTPSGDSYDEGVAAGRQQCIDDPASCGIGGECLAFGDNLSLEIPCAAVGDKRYGFKFMKTNPLLLRWEIDLSTIVEK